MKPTTCSAAWTINFSIIKWIAMLVVVAMLLLLSGRSDQSPTTTKKPDPLELRLDPL